MIKTSHAKKPKAKGKMFVKYVSPAIKEVNGYQVSGVVYPTKAEANEAVIRANKSVLLNLCTDIAKVLENPREEDFDDNLTEATLQVVADALYVALIITTRVGGTDQLHYAIEHAETILRDKTDWSTRMPQYT